MKFISIIFFVIFLPSYLIGQSISGSYRTRFLQNTYQVHEIGVLYIKQSFKFSSPYSLKVHPTGNYQSFSFHQAIPKKIVLNDSLGGNLSGYNISYMIGRDFMYPIRDLFNVNDNGHFQCFTSIGFDLGRLRMYNNPLLRKKKWLFCS